MRLPERAQAYEEALAELRAAFAETTDPTARMATAAAVLHARFTRFFWTGFYLLVDGELTVGPYQGTPACLILEKHKGVCWAGIDRGQPVVVANVHDFPGHIACDGRANSELVLPLRDADDRIVGVLDVDSGDFDAFDEVDVNYLGTVARMIFAGWASR